MPETAFPTEMVIPGTFIRVQAEGLISVGGISSGNIGIIGTAEAGSPEGTVTLSDYTAAVEAFGYFDGVHNLPRALGVLFQNGARTVYARGVESMNNLAVELAELVKDDVNILVLPELATATAIATLRPILNAQEETGKDLIAVVGSDAATTAASSVIVDQVVVDKRLIMTAPGIVVRETSQSPASPPASPPTSPPEVELTTDDVTLSGTYSAAAVAGLLSTLAPQSSPTNKTLAGVVRLARRFSYGQTKDLLNGGVMALEDRLGIRVVRGITTENNQEVNGPFKQVTTRRITDLVKAGVRRASDPFIGRLNNERVRGALRGAIDGFLTTLVVDEALIGYTLEVTATRADEIAGRAVVNAIIQPTFSIDFIRVTLVLQ